MFNQSSIVHKRNILLLLLFLLLNCSLAEEINTQMEPTSVLYPSVLSLNNGGLVVVQTDGIHFYNQNKEEEESKTIKFDFPIKSEKENEKISISQYPENEGGYILILVREKIYIFQSSGNLLKEENLPEINSVANVRLIPYKEQDNNLLYVLTYKVSEKKFGFNYYKYD